MRIGDVWGHHRMGRIDRPGDDAGMTADTPPAPPGAVKPLRPEEDLMLWLLLIVALAVAAVVVVGMLIEVALWTLLVASAAIAVALLGLQFGRRAT